VDVRRFAQTPDGQIRLQLPLHERQILRELAEAVRALVGKDDPAVGRLFPPAYEDEELEREYRQLTRAQLTARHEQALVLMEETVDRDVLSQAEGDAWLRGLNDARLVLGTALDIREEFDWDALDPGDPRAPDLALYAYASWIQEQLVDVSAGPG
jgi:hypothetical protein